MVERIREYNNLVKKEHTLICPDCNEELKDTNVVLTTYPAMYQYFCPKCGYETTARRIYPWVEIVGDLACSYQQEVSF